MWLFAFILTFILVPLIEVALFIQVGKVFGTIATLGVIAALAIAGAMLVRWQGVAVLRDIGASLDRGEIPGDRLIDGALVVAAGALLITPGFFTDIIGLFVILPPGRNLIRGAVKRAFRRRVARYRLVLDA